MRTGQVPFRQSLGKTETILKGQLYVDDPALSARGPLAGVQHAFDVLLMWWLALGLPLAWKKGLSFMWPAPLGT